MFAFDLTSVTLILMGWLGLGLVSLVLSAQLARRVVFPLSGLLAVALVGGCLSGDFARVETGQWPIGLPGTQIPVRVDALSRSFLILLGLVAGAVSTYATGYFREMSQSQPSALHRVTFFYPLFLASMGSVLVADGAYGFMVAWEIMALSSWFLVTVDHGHLAIRQAGFVYLLMAHVGALCLLVGFSWLSVDGHYDFAAMRQAHLSAGAASGVFLLGLLGFGAKAGLLPLHVWLPEAHPAAPSPVSALMSGVMLKMALYGLLRLLFDLLGKPIWWWGVLLIIVGSLTALFGVLFAAVQFDIKRLLAWSSVENMGLLFSGLGLTVLFHSAGQDTVAALSLAAVLYHALNHALFKSLLFLSCGSVLHATQERNMGKLGGLIRVMPWVAGTTLVGTLSLAGLPPFNGFVSEWLMLQAYLLRPDFPQAWLDMTLPLGAAVLALVGGLSGFAMVKFYGIVFLGQPRGLDLNAATVHDADRWERSALLFMALGCLLLGVLPKLVLARLDAVTQSLLGAEVALAPHDWLWLTPVSAQRASYSPLILLLLILLVVAATWWGVRRAFHGRWRRAPAWDCGYAAQTWRMQDSADGFGQPIKQIFEGIFGLSRTLPDPLDPVPQYFSEVRDPFWAGLYQPLVKGVERLSVVTARLLQGRIAVYLLYSFLTLLGLLALVTGSTP